MRTKRDVKDPCVLVWPIPSMSKYASSCLSFPLGLNEALDAARRIVRGSGL